MDRVYQPQEIYALEKQAIQTQNISARVLMERAGQASLHYLQMLWPHAKTIGIVCGCGNNGGDGYALALLAQQIGLTVLIGHDRAAGESKAPAHELTW